MADEDQRDGQPDKRLSAPEREELLREWGPLWAHRTDLPVEEFVLVADLGLTPEQVRPYARDWEPGDVHALVTDGVSAEEAARWSPRLTGRGVVCLRRAGVTADEAWRWPSRLPVHGIAALAAAGVTEAEAHEWPERFGWDDILLLRAADLAPREAAGYPEWMGGAQITKLAWMGVAAELADLVLGAPMPDGDLDDILAGM